MPLPRRQLANDNFNRADASPAGAPWVTVGGGGMRIVSNQMNGVTVSADNASYWDGGVNWPGDQWTEVTIAAAFGGGDDFGPQVRMQVGANSGYVLEIGNTTTIGIIYRVSAGAYTNILTLSGVTFAVGDRIRLEVQGSTLTAYQNDIARGTVEDTTWTSGFPGLHHFNNSATWAFDDFYAGDYEYLPQQPNAPAIGSYSYE